ncbi:hypothetical protein [Caballeronia sp. DA-9]|uniref:hypothetical protein n=1 Tax=Caballeronia sp. DA-9 TaxID=3436237 RepID=UPI003F66CAFD
MDLLNAVFINDEAFPGMRGTPFVPSDFESGALVTAVAATQERLYAELRVRGFGRADSFGAAFGGSFVGTLDAIEAAAAAYELSAFYRLHAQDAFERIGLEKLQTEWSSRLAEMSSFTKDYAIARRVEIAREEDSSDVNEFSLKRARRELIEVAAERDREHEKHEIERALRNQRQQPEHKPDPFAESAVR